MSRTPHAQRKPRTRLAAWRLKRGATQAEMAKDTGIPMSSYQRIEAGDYDRLPYQQLLNCSIVLECSVEELIEERFRHWTVFHQDAKRRPRVPSWRQTKPDGK